jgi:hypothetical protein
MDNFDAARLKQVCRRRQGCVILRRVVSISLGQSAPIARALRCTNAANREREKSPLCAQTSTNHDS